MSFILIFRKHLLQRKWILFLGLVSFSITQIPHLLILNSGAFTRRISQVDYLNDQFFQVNSGNLRLFPLGKTIFIVREFFSQYLAYFSPKNLFFDPDPQGARSMPDLSVFYPWMIIPFIFGLKSFLTRYRSSFIQMLVLLIILAPIPASLTRDPFSTIRILVFLWGVTIIIAYGAQYLLDKIACFKFKALVIAAVILFSLVQLYLSYFVLLKYERSENYGYSYLELLKKIETMTDKQFVVDSSRELGTGIRFAFIKKYDPLSLQKVLNNQVKGNYYSNFEFDEPYTLDNIEARPIIWGKDVYKEQILAGDLLAISDNQVKEHFLKFIFDIKDRAGNIALKAYITNPMAKCQSDKSNGQFNLKNCSKY